MSVSDIVSTVKAGAAAVSGALAFAALVVATWKKVRFERAADKAENEKDTSDLDKSLSE